MKELTKLYRAINFTKSLTTLQEFADIVYPFLRKSSDPVYSSDEKFTLLIQSVNMGAAERFINCLFPDAFKRDFDTLYPFLGRTPKELLTTKRVVYLRGCPFNQLLQHPDIKYFSTVKTFKVRASYARKRAEHPNRLSLVIHTSDMSPFVARRIKSLRIEDISIRTLHTVDFNNLYLEAWHN